MTGDKARAAFWCRLPSILQQSKGDASPNSAAEVQDFVRERSQWRALAGAAPVAGSVPPDLDVLQLVVLGEYQQAVAHLLADMPQRSKRYYRWGAFICSYDTYTVAT